MNSRRGGTSKRETGLGSATLALLVFALFSGPLVGTSLSAGGSTQATALSGSGSTAGLRATIRRTSHGIPRILASNFAGLGYGYGYSLAKDNICVVAEQYVTVNGERSRYFGPNGSYSQGGNGSSNNNLNSDFFYQRIKDAGTIEELLLLAPPAGPRPEIGELARGYVAGYNRYLRETGVDNISDPGCSGAPWVREIDEMDVFQRFYQLGLLASGGVAIDGIGEAQPPTGPVQSPTPTETNSMLGELKQSLPLGGVGSNAIGLGKDATDNGRGMMLGNPHFPWDGSERFYESQLTIPGVIDVSGASLLGVPLVLIGHTDNLAWSHTVSTGYRFTPFEETLVPGSPTTYLYDGQPRQMEAETVTVQAKLADGSLEPRTRTLYSTQHGWIFNSLLGQDLFPWTPATAFALGDANATNFRYLNHFLETDEAQSVGELDEILKRNEGIPWVNTLAADSSGKAYYADISVVPNVSNSKAQICNTPVGAGTYEALRLPVLDGSRSSCEWDTDPDAVEPGIFGPSHLPSLLRDDYVENGNDSYWLTNPNQPITGYARIIGDEDTERSLRTRAGLVMIEQRLNGTDGLPGNRFTRQQLQDTVFNNRQYTGELWRDDLVTMCNANPVIPNSSGQPVDVSEACPILTAWDLHDDLDSRGALLFRRFASRALAAVGLSRPPGIFLEPYSSADPVHTPRGLNIANARVQQAFADAVTDLRSSGIALDARLGDYQYERRGTERIPIHGGPGSVGVFNAINVGWVQGQGYPNVPHGSSFVYVTQFTDGCPQTRNILTYSQSTNPNSPYFADQTRMFSQKQWVVEPFCESDILADPNLEVVTIEDSGYPHPQSASPITTSLVPSFKQCGTSGNPAHSAHAPPLAVPSCGSPKTTGSAHLGASSVASASLTVDAGNPATAADEADVGLQGQITDVRGGNASGNDYVPVPGGPDANLRFRLRLTDLSNGASPPEPATATDLDFFVPLECTATPSAATGSTCATSTTANTILPGAITEGAAMVADVFRVRVDDAGPDLTLGTSDDRLFAQQGVFVP